jgi:tetratricopeptide (TPR) repeat protein
MSKEKLIFFVAVVLIAPVIYAAVHLPRIYMVIQRNRLALSVAQQALAGRSGADLSQFSDLAYDCRANWLLGSYDNERSQTVSLNRYWQQAIACDSQYIAWIYQLSQNDPEIARRVNYAYPESSVGWFWLAELIALEDPVQAITYYRKGLEYEPGAGIRWLELGILLRQMKDYSEAMQAFYKACVYGDPGYNGCLYAGNMAELLGDDKQAIRYYRMSLWPQARAQADALEQKILDK